MTEQKLQLKLPRVLLGDDEEAVANAVLSNLTAHPNIFQRGSMMATVVNQPPIPKRLRLKADVDPPPTLMELEAETLRERITATMMFVTKNLKGKLVPAKLPDKIVNAILARKNWEAIKNAVGITTTPVLLADGGLHSQVGYDPDTGLIFEPNCHFPAIKAKPSQADAAAAVETLRDVLHDFPFESPEHEAAMIAAWLTPACRFALPARPLIAFDSNCPGTGKGLLGDLISLTWTGRPMPKGAYPDKDDEMRKVITAVLLAGFPLHCFDNLESPLGGAAIDAAVTATTWTDRILGGNRQVTMTNTVILFCTGNNLVLCGDSLRRILPIRLVTNEEHPEDRQDFRHPRLLEHVAQNRGQLVSACLTILTAYQAAGRPNVGLTPWGSFEVWCDLVRSACVFAGLPDPCATRLALRDRDTKLEMLHALIAALDEVDPQGQGVTVSRMTQLYAVSDAYAGAVTPRYPALHNALDLMGYPQASNKTIGKHLQANEGRIVAGRYLCGKDKDRTKTTVWKLRKA